MKFTGLNAYKAAGGAYIAKQGLKKATAENNAKLTGGAYIAAKGTQKYKNQYVAAWAAKWAK